MSSTAQAKRRRISERAPAQTNMSPFQEAHAVIMERCTFVPARSICDPSYEGKRHVLTEWVMEVCVELKYKNTTTHLAISIMDNVLVSLKVSTSKLQLVAMACILIAGKLEEFPGVAPTLRMMNAYSENSYSETALCEMEVFVLRLLDWRLQHTLPIHLLYLLADVGFVFSTDSYGGKSLANTHSSKNLRSALRRLLRIIMEHAEYCLDISVHEFDHIKQHPLIVACAAIAATRAVFRITPPWPPQLAEKTGLTWLQIQPWTSRLCELYKKASGPECSAVIELLAPSSEQAPSPQEVTGRHIFRSLGATTSQLCLDENAEKDGTQ